MKKKVLLSVGALTISAAAFTTGVLAATDIKLFVNGRQSTADIQIIDGSSYIPLRAVSEMLGAEVKWDGDSRTINITGKDAAHDPAFNSNVKVFNLNVSIDSGPMKMNISKVTFDPAYKKDQYSSNINALIMDVKIENNSTDTVRWYPTHGKVALNTKEQIESASFYSDNIDGEFIGKVIKTGKLIFEVKGNLNEINSMNLVVDSPYDGKSYTDLGQSKTTEIILK